MSKQSYKNAIAKSQINKKVDSSCDYKVPYNQNVEWEDLGKTMKPKKRFVAGFKILNNLTEAEVLEKSKIYTDRVNLEKGSVYGTNKDFILSEKSNEVFVLTRGKEDIILDVKKEKLDLNDFNIGDKMNVSVVQTKQGLIGSMNGNVKNISNETLYNSIGTDNYFEALVLSSSFQGYWVSINGIKAYMPGSLANLTRLEDFTSIVGTKLKVLIVNHERGNFIASHRDYQKMINVEESKQFKIGTKVSGLVTGVTKKGAFVKLSETVYGLLLNTNQIVKDEYVDVYVKGFDESDRIILTQNFEDLNQWDFIDEYLQVGNKVLSKVEKFNKQVAFVGIWGNIKGKIKLSQLPENVRLNSGEEVAVVVTKIDKTNKIVFCDYID